MSTTVTSIPVHSTSFLFGGTYIEFAQKQYQIIKPNKVNYLVRDEKGKRFNIPRHAVGISVLPNLGWKASTSELTALPALKLAQAVRITGKGARKFEGKKGFIAKINATTYHVLIPGETVITASHALVVAD